MAYIPPEMIEKARQVDLLTYLQTCEPGELVHLGGNHYCTREHDSLKISNGKWYWFSRGFGGYNALDYLIKVKEVPFMEAVERITGQATYLPPTQTHTPKPKKEKVLLLPKASRCATHVYNYLRSRGIDKKGYEVKVGKDISVRPPGKPRFVRLARNFGDAYTLEGIRRRILEQSRATRPLPEPAPKRKQYRVSGNWKDRKKVTGFRALYFHYCYLLGVFPKEKQQNRKRLHFLLREDLIKLETITQESKKTTPQIPIQQPAQTKPTIKDASTIASRSIKTAEKSGKTIKQGAEAAGKTIKTAAHTINTAEQTGNAAIKTTEVAFRMVQRTAIESARASQRIQAAAKAANSTAKALAAATAKAVRAIIAAAQGLTTALIAGGGTVVVLVVVMIVMCFAGMMLASDEDDTEVLPISEEVMAYKPIIQQYAREHGIGDYVLLIQAVMMQESGGRGNDPMQCSECNFNTLYPHVPGGITDPEYSINVGIQNLADCLQIAQCESPMDMDAVKLALQGYNYGQGYITWAMNKYGEYSKANAIEFSMKTAEAYGWDSYGDMDYVPHVLRYYPLGQIFYDPDTSALIVEVARSQIGNVGGEPYWSWYGFTERVDWCACFVSWCANQCGYIEAGVIPKFSGCEWGVYWFRQHDQWAGRNITPTPGMIVFFDWEDEEGGGLDGGADHVGIVERVENGRVYTIEGNTADSCQERSYPLGHFEILGYAVLVY